MSQQRGGNNNNDQRRDSIGSSSSSGHHSKRQSYNRTNSNSGGSGGGGRDKRSNRSSTHQRHHNRDHHNNNNNNTRNFNNNSTGGSNSYSNANSAGGGPTPNNQNNELAENKLMFVLLNLVGKNVTVECKNGSFYTGLFHTANCTEMFGIVLKMAYKLDKNKKQEGSPVKSLVILGKDVIGMTAMDVDFSPPKETTTAGFKTDSAISGNSGDIKERTLQKWEPSEKDVSGDLDDSRHVVGAWDQFETNERMFGVTTDFDENNYTTILDKSDPDFKKKEADAIRVANEIARSSTKNTHLAEERGHAVDSGDVDEEDKYSSVLRSNGNSQQKYSAPGFKKSSSSRGGANPSYAQKMSEKSMSTPATNSPLKLPEFASSGSWGDDVADPVVVKNAWSTDRPFNKPGSDAPPTQKKSSEAVRNSSPPQKQPSTKPEMKYADSVTRRSKHTSQDARTQDARQNSSAQDARTQDVRASDVKNQDTRSHQDSQRGNAPSRDKGGRDGSNSRQPNRQQRQNSNDQKSQQSKQHSQDQQQQQQQQPTGDKAKADAPSAEPVARAFARFASTEKEHHRQKQKREIGAVINDLKSFSASFKLHTPVPDDLKELFSKSQSGSKESLNVESVEGNSVDNNQKESKAPTPSTKAPPGIQKSTSKDSASTNKSGGNNKTVTQKPSSFKLNVKAMEFKPNPNAASFIPSAPVQMTVEKLCPFFGSKVVDKTPLSVNAIYSSGFERSGTSKSAVKPSETPTTWPCQNPNISFRTLPSLFQPGIIPQQHMMPVAPFDETQMFEGPPQGYPTPYGYGPQVPYGYPPRPPPPMQMGRGFPPNYIPPYGPPQYPNMMPPPQMYPRGPPPVWQHQQGPPPQQLAAPPMMPSSSDEGSKS